MNDWQFIGILIAACSFCVGVGTALGWYLRGYREDTDTIEQWECARRALAQPRVLR